jgi:hypothetical protein
MAAGLPDHVWSLEEMILMADSYMSRQARPLQEKKLKLREADAASVQHGMARHYLPGRCCHALRMRGNGQGDDTRTALACVSAPPSIVCHRGIRVAGICRSRFYPKVFKLRHNLAEASV